MPSNVRQLWQPVDSSTCPAKNATGASSFGIFHTMLLSDMLEPCRISKFTFSAIFFLYLPHTSPEMPLYVLLLLLPRWHYIFLQVTDFYLLFALLSYGLLLRCARTMLRTERPYVVRVRWICLRFSSVSLWVQFCYSWVPLNAWYRQPCILCRAFFETVRRVPGES